MNQTVARNVLLGVAPLFESESPARSFRIPSFTLTRTSTLGFAQTGAAVKSISRGQVRYFIVVLLFVAGAQGNGFAAALLHFNFARACGHTYTPGALPNKSNSSASAAWLKRSYS